MKKKIKSVAVIGMPIILTTCAKISENLSFNCDDPIVGGIGSEITLINFDDWLAATITKNPSNPLNITNIVLPSGVTGYKISGPEYVFSAKYSQVRMAYGPSFAHSVDGFVFDISPTAKQQLEKLAKGKVVAIVSNNNKGTSGNTAFEVYGADSGLILNMLDKDSSNKDSQGAPKFTLGNHPDHPEPHLPASIWSTDYTTSKAIVDSLAA